jgi:hypothetical protein
MMRRSVAYVANSTERMVGAKKLSAPQLSNELVSLDRRMTGGKFKAAILTALWQQARRLLLAVYTS